MFENGDERSRFTPALGLKANLAQFSLLVGVNALVGGMQAFLEYPEQFEKLKGDPTLVDSAVEEVVRWTSPVSGWPRSASTPRTGWSWRP